MANIRSSIAVVGSLPLDMLLAFCSIAVYKPPRIAKYRPADAFHLPTHPVCTLPDAGLYSMSIDLLVLCIFPRSIICDPL